VYLQLTKAGVPTIKHPSSLGLALGGRPEEARASSRSPAKVKPAKNKLIFLECVTRRTSGQFPQNPAALQAKSPAHSPALSPPSRLARVREGRLAGASPSPPTARRSPNDLDEGHSFLLNNGLGDFLGPFHSNGIDSLDQLRTCSDEFLTTTIEMKRAHLKKFRRALWEESTLRLPAPSPEKEREARAVSFLSPSPNARPPPKGGDSGGPRRTSPEHWPSGGYASGGYANGGVDDEEDGDGRRRLGLFGSAVDAEDRSAREVGNNGGGGGGGGSARFGAFASMGRFSVFSSSARPQASPGAPRSASVGRVGSVGRFGSVGRAPVPCYELVWANDSIFSKETRLRLRAVSQVLVGPDAIHVFSCHGDPQAADRYLALVQGDASTERAAAKAKTYALEFPSEWQCGRFLRAVRRLGHAEGNPAFFRTRRET